MEETLERLCHKYGFLVEGEPEEHAMNALAEAFLAGEKSRLELLEVK